MDQWANFNTVHPPTENMKPFFGLFGFLNYEVAS